MKAYFIRRLLLVLPTLLGITLIVFSVTRFAPGGPMERALQAAAAGGEGQEGNSDHRNSTLSEDELESMEEQYGQDKPLLVAYFQWLGVAPKEDLIVKKEYGGAASGDTIDANFEVQMVLIGDDRLVSVKQADGELESFSYVNGKAAGADPRKDGWSVRIESPDDRKARKARRENIDVSEVGTEYTQRAVVYKERFSGLVQGDLGHSLAYGDSVWSMIFERVPIAFYFGILSTFIIYGICIPLGVLKAIQHRSWFDNVSSIAIFVGYSIPGYALGAVLLVYLGARLGWFPLFGLTSEGFDDLSLWQQVKDVAHHTVLPLICYVVSGFAFLTMMMKNNLMENLSADYVRTAMAKGVSFRRAVVGHAFRNSFIPIATGLGNLIAIFVGGSMLIENVFDIQGFGMLQYQAVLNNDYPVVMGTLTIAAFLMLIGNILSDVIVSFVDPRIKFN
ncbi:ABC transporter permease subunit [Rubritalea sp.]|uniref:ABC transporter permease subunit n=1 Tax=Rubritalea sp. TaxID=2109375 RepID=UPI003EF6F263